MSTVAEAGSLRGSHTKVKTSWSPSVEVGEMRSGVRDEAERESLRLLKATARYCVPIEPVAIAGDLGVQVLDLELNQNTLGALLMRPGEDPRIVLNERHTMLRRRFTCALELGHFVRRSAETDRYRRVDRTGPLASLERDPEALLAYEFAACLLMPKLRVEVFREMGMDDLDMAMRFLVPRETMQFRLNGLGLGATGLELA